MGENIMAKDKFLTEYGVDLMDLNAHEADAFEYREEVSQMMAEMLVHADTDFAQLLHKVDQDEDMPPVGESEDVNMEM